SGAARPRAQPAAWGRPRPTRRGPPTLPAETLGPPPAARPRRPPKSSILPPTRPTGASKSHLLNMFPQPRAHRIPAAAPQTNSLFLGVGRVPAGGAQRPRRDRPRLDPHGPRAEERRVGKAGRSRGGHDHATKQR